MAGELRFRARLDATKTMAEIVANTTRMTADQLADYYFIVQFDRDRIKLPPRPDGIGIPESDEQDIHTLIRNNWTGNALDINELELVMAPFAVYHMIPIVIEMYPKIETERAERGEKVEPTFQEMYDDIDRRAREDMGREDVRLALKALDELSHAFSSSWGTAQGRTGDGRFGGTVATDTTKPKDIVTSMYGNVVTFAPSGQIRLPTGRLGPKPVNKKGKPFHPSAPPDDDPFRMRRDGHVWMRVRGRPGKKVKTRWIRIT